MCFSKSSLKLILKMVLQLRRAKKGPRISLYKYEIFWNSEGSPCFPAIKFEKDSRLIQARASSTSEQCLHTRPQLLKHSTALSTSMGITVVLLDQKNMERTALEKLGRQTRPTSFFVVQKLGCIISLTNYYTVLCTQRKPQNAFL